LQSAREELEQQVRRLTETVTQETERREGAEAQVRELGERRNGLEAQLSELREELQVSQKQLLAHQESSGAEQFRLDARTQAYSRRKLKWRSGLNG
jgi:uncharacterized coiled-coil DUF342 family protein